MSEVTSPIILDSTGQDIVTQLAGILGALSDGEVGSNTNGTYIKLNNGILICYKTKTVSVTFTAWGTLYESSVINVGSPAHNFVDTPVVMATLNNSASAAFTGTVANITNSDLGTNRVYRPNNPGTISVTVAYLAIGKWKL